jgi:hypothetical protein
MTVLLGGGVAAFLSIDPVSNWIYEERAYQAMMASQKMDVSAPLHFIAAFPKSSHVKEAVEMQDDRNFTQALAMGKMQKSNVSTSIRGMKKRVTLLLGSSIMRANLPPGLRRPLVTGVRRDRT